MAFALYAAGSPLIVDYEEAILSRGDDLAAIVRNLDGGSLASNQDKLIGKDKLDRASLETFEVLVPLFTPGHRYKAVQEVIALARTKGAEVTFGTLRHATAIVASSATLSQGTFVNAGVTIGAEAIISEHCIVNRSASIGHHVELHQYVSIGPAATLAGQIRVGCGSVIGAGAVILPGVEIGENAVVAAGSVVSAKSVASHTIVSGNPARPRGRAIVGYGKTSVPSADSSA